MSVMLHVCNTYKSEYGWVIVGVNPDYDSLTLDAIKAYLIGKKIIKNINGETTIIEVVDVKESRSMWDKKNLFLLIADNQISTQIEPGWEIISE